jgi:ribosome-binding protein aMBF1 (putative translation factor)
MTADEFTEALQLIGWSQRQLAAMLDCDNVIVWRWATGRADIPASIAVWIRRIAACHEKHAVPDDWRVRT